MLSSHTTVLLNTSPLFDLFLIIVEEESFAIKNNNIKYKYSAYMTWRMSFFMSGHMTCTEGTERNIV